MEIGYNAVYFRSNGFYFFIFKVQRYYFFMTW